MEKYKLVNKMVKLYMQVKEVDSTIDLENLQNLVSQIFNFMVLQNVVNEYSFTDAQKVEDTNIFEFEVYYKCNKSFVKV